MSIRSFLKYLHLRKQADFDKLSLLQLPLKRTKLPKNILSEHQIADPISQPDITTKLGIRNRTIFKILYATGIHLPMAGS